MNIYGAKQLASSFRTVRKNTVQIAEEIPAEQYGFRAAEGTKSVAELLTHIANVTKLWLRLHQIDRVTDMNHYNFGPLMAELQAGEATIGDKDAIVAWLKADGEAFALFLEGLTDEFLAEEVIQGGGQETKSRLEGLMGAKEHEMHHRGQLMLTQRMLGMEPHMTRNMKERMAAMMARQAQA